jgi:hypothetical protein
MEDRDLVVTTRRFLDERTSEEPSAADHQDLHPRDPTARAGGALIGHSTAPPTAHPDLEMAGASEAEDRQPIATPV